MFVLVVMMSLLAFAAGVDDNGVFVGRLKTKQHNTKGAVYAVDEKTLLIKNFTYDGTAPDAFFWVGTNGIKPTLDGTILPYPFAGKFYEYSDKESPKLMAVLDGTKDIRLTLPDNLNVSDLKWFSVWCREFEVVLGELIFPDDFSFDKILFPGQTFDQDSNAIDDKAHGTGVKIIVKPLAVLISIVSVAIPYFF